MRAYILGWYMIMNVLSVVWFNFTYDNPLAIVNTEERLFLYCRIMPLKMTEKLIRLALSAVQAAKKQGRECSFSWYLRNGTKMFISEEIQVVSSPITGLSSFNKNIYPENVTSKVAKLFRGSKQNGIR